MIKKTVAVLAAALLGGLLTAVPVEASAGDHIMGHRCRVYDRAVSNEDTVAALIDTATGVPGALCEIDAWQIADGTVIVWHDTDWRRVANPNTLPAGMTARDKIVNSTWAQVRQIRTRGGQPVARLEDMIDAAAQYDIPLVVDIRNTIRDASSYVQRANAVGADVSYYQLIAANCNFRNTDRFRTAGARIGAKLLGACPQTPAQLDARGVEFTSELSFRLTDAYLADMNARGIAVGVLDGGMTETRAESLVARGVSRVLLDYPREALGWFS